MTLGFLSGSSNFCKLLWDPREVLVLHGCAWIRWEAKSCTTKTSVVPLHYCVFCTGPLTFDLWQISQFRSWGKWVWTLQTQILTSLECGLWRHFIKRTGVWTAVFRNFVFHKMFSEFLQPLEDFRTRRVIPFYQQRVSPFFLWLFEWFLELLAWSTSGLPDLSSTVVRHWHWRGVTFNSILSFSSLSITYRRWWRRAWRRCRTMTRLSWKCHWSWMIRTRGRTRWQAWSHNKNEVLRVAGYPNPVFHEH